MLTDHLAEKVTTASAWGAVASPVWLPKLAHVSQACATVAPILGVAWLLFQFACKLRDEWRAWRGSR
jgi:hypothetical protein